MSTTSMVQVSCKLQNLGNNLNGLENSNSEIEIKSEQVDDFELKFEELHHSINIKAEVDGESEGSLDTESASVAKYGIYEPSISSRKTSREPSLTRTVTPEVRDSRTPRRGKKRKKSETTVELSANDCTAASESFRSISNIFKGYAKVEPAIETKTEDDIYGKYVAVRLKALNSTKIKLKARNQIDKLLFEAAMNEK